MKKLDKFRRVVEEDSALSSISDLMSGLMIVFLFIAVSFMSRVSDENIEMKNQKETVQKVINAYEVTKGNIYTDLYDEFKDSMGEWKMEVDLDGTIRFTEPEVFFETGEAKIKDRFKKILDEFFPRYVKLINEKYKDELKEIRIEGHTSSAWKEGSSELESYFENMALSQERTRNVLNYVMKLDVVKTYRSWLIDHITANGMSYSKRVMEDGKENEDKSKRVEFKILTNSEEVIEELVQEYNN